MQSVDMTGDGDSYSTENWLCLILSHLNSIPGWIALMMVVWLLVLIWALVSPWRLGAWMRREASSQAVSSRRLWLDLAGCLVLPLSAVMTFLMELATTWPGITSCYDCGYKKEGVLVAVPLALMAGLLIAKVNRPVTRRVLFDLCWCCGVLSALVVLGFVVVVVRI